MCNSACCYPQSTSMKSHMGHQDKYSSYVFHYWCVLKTWDENIIDAHPVTKMVPDYFSYPCYIIPMNPVLGGFLLTSPHPSPWILHKCWDFLPFYLQLGPPGTNYHHQFFCQKIETCHHLLCLYLPQINRLYQFQLLWENLFFAFNKLNIEESFTIKSGNSEAGKMTIFDCSTMVCLIINEVIYLPFPTQPSFSMVRLHPTLSQARVVSGWIISIVNFIPKVFISYSTTSPSLFTCYILAILLSCTSTSSIW